MKPPSKAAEYITRNQNALHDNNPCNWPGYDPIETWKRLAHEIGYGLREFDPQDVKLEMGSLYGIVAMCCIMGRQKVPFDNKQFMKWINERYQESEG